MAPPAIFLYATAHAIGITRSPIQKTQRPATTSTSTILASPELILVLIAIDITQASPKYPNTATSRMGNSVYSTRSLSKPRSWLVSTLSRRPNSTPMYQQYTKTEPSSHSCKIWTSLSAASSNIPLTNIPRLPALNSSTFFKLPPAGRAPRSLVTPYTR